MSKDRRERVEGLTPAERKRRDDLRRALQRLRSPRERAAKPAAHRDYYTLLRDRVHLFEDVVSRLNASRSDLKGNDSRALRRETGDAIDLLGGMPEPSAVSLKAYRHDLHGPFLGVSDDGSAADEIRRAALSSPKMRVLGPSPPIVVGVAQDAERLAAVGEVAVGPEEYREIRLACHHSILTSTNVGTRLNLRFFKRRPIVDVAASGRSSSLDAAMKALRAALLPFVRTPDGEPRPTTILLRFPAGMRRGRRAKLLGELRTAFLREPQVKAKIHRLALFAETGQRRGARVQLEREIELASRAGIGEVAFRGVVRREADDQISMPGLLQYFSAGEASTLLGHARKRRLVLKTVNEVDPDTVARHVWAPLQIAHNNGLELGKYGLFPLTMDESEIVMGLVQSWFSSWTAAPVFYIDFPAIDAERTYGEEEVLDALQAWLKHVAKHGIPVVLFDTGDKGKGRRLLKRVPSDRRGILSATEVQRVDRFAADLGIKALWAGGISLTQAFELGKIGVFGIYVTTAVTESHPVSTAYHRDPMLTFQRQPTFQGVGALKLLLEAGFLASRLEAYRLPEAKRELEASARRYLASLARSQTAARWDADAAELGRLTEEAWRTHYARRRHPVAVGARQDAQGP